MMSTLRTDEIILRELAAFAAANGFSIQVRQLNSYAQKMAAQIASQGRPSQQSRLLTRKQCAAFLGVSLPTLDRYIREEGLPFRVKNPTTNRRKHYVFVETDVIKWAESHLSGDRIGSPT